MLFYTKFDDNCFYKKHLCFSQQKLVCMFTITNVIIFSKIYYKLNVLEFTKWDGNCFYLKRLFVSQCKVVYLFTIANVMFFL